MTILTQNELINQVAQVEETAEANAFNTGDGLTLSSDTYNCKKISFTGNRPTLNNGIASNFRGILGSEADGMLAVPNVLKGVQYTSFEFVTRFYYLYSNSYNFYEQTVFATTADTARNNTLMGLQIWAPYTNSANYQLKFTFKAANNAEVTLTSGSGIFKNNQWHWLKVTYSNTSGYAYYLSEDGETWNLVNSSAITAPLDTTRLGDYIFYGAKNIHGRFPINREIDLANSYIKVNGVEVWHGYEVGKKQLRSNVVNNATSETSIAFTNKIVTSNGCIAIGNNSEISKDNVESSDNSIVIGADTRSVGQGNVVIGPSTTAYEYSNTYYKGNVAIGYRSCAVGPSNVVIGDWATTDETSNSTAIGYHACVWGGVKDAIQLGYGTNEENGALYFGVSDDGTGAGEDSDEDIASPANYKLIGRDGLIPAERLLNAAPPLTNIAIAGNNITFTQGVSNYLVVGSEVTIEDNIASGFSTEDYILPADSGSPFYNKTITSFEIITKVRLQEGTETGVIFFNNLNPEGSEGLVSLGVNSSGKFYAELTSSNYNTVWAEQDSDYSIEPDTWYWVKVVWDSTEYGGLNIYVSTNGRSYTQWAWSYDSTYELCHDVANRFMIGTSLFEDFSIESAEPVGDPFTGEIDLSQTIVKINGEEEWCAYDSRKTIISATGESSGGTSKVKYNNPALTSVNDICTWTVTHTLNTQDIVAQVYDNTTNKLITANIIPTTASSITVELTSSNNISANAYRIVIIG